MLHTLRGFFIVRLLRLLKRASMPLWRLPDNLSDVLPTEARQLEALRHTALDVLRTWGYEMVTPPLLESLSALTTGTAQDLDAVMFKVVDPLTGQLLGLRADVTPQAARIDAHLLNRISPTRLCYCAPALRSQVGDAFSQRELLQLGAELFGHAGIEADVEIQDLSLQLLSILGINGFTLALSHSGVLTAVFASHPDLRTVQASVLEALRSKNRTDLSSLCQAYAPQAEPLLLALASAYGSIDDVQASQFAAWPAVAAAITTLHQLAGRAQAQGVSVVIDLADLSGYGYHTGVQFAIYINGLTSSLLRGGRYDAVGEVFGRARAATGFSLDLRVLASLLPPRNAMPAVLAPWVDDNDLKLVIAQLRADGHVVVRSLPGHAAEQDEFHCNRALVKKNGQWEIETLL
jgi:ATP phosphoribosyltransferase regulatory subunit